MPNIENKIYYYPYYCYRHFPSLEDGLVDIINTIANVGKIAIYQNLENASKAGNEMLCDDDTFGILVIDCRSGAPKIKENPEQRWGKILSFDFRKFLEIKD